MREKDTQNSLSEAASFMSPSQVKQTLSKLDKDGETRRNAMESLKKCVETMDAASVPRFLAQVSDAKEKGSSRAYAISLYVDVARVHGKLIIPHIPRVMTTVTRTLSSSGSSPQLQQACANVLSSVAKYAIDEDSPVASDVLRDLCTPLMEVLTGKLEPLAAGAALCLQTLVDNEKWNCASAVLVDDLCLKTTIALAEKYTRTVAHMQLARSLAEINPSFLSSYGVALLRSAADVLKAPAASASWQQRASAARLLTAVLPTVDRATLVEELKPTVQALDNCKHDRMSNVRWSVKEALKTAKAVLTEENSRRFSDGEELLSWMIGSPESSSSSPRRSSLGGVSSDDMMSPPGWNSNKIAKAPRRSSSVSSVNPLSFALSDSPLYSIAAGSAPTSLSGELRHRSPLRATRLHLQASSLDASATSFHNSESPRKENLPSHDPDTKIGTLDFDSDMSPSDTPTHVRQTPSANEEAVAPYPASPGVATLRNSLGIGTSPGVISKRSEENSLFSKENFVSRVGRDEQGGGSLAEDTELFSYSNRGTDRTESRHEAEQMEMKTANRDGSKDLLTNGGVSRGQHGVLDGSTMKHVFELKGPVTGSTLKNSSRSHDVDENASTGVNPSNSISDWKEPCNGLLGSPLKVDTPSLLATLKDAQSPQKVKPLIGAEDFLPFTTPRRLVRSLQKSFSSPKLESSTTKFVDRDVTKVRGEDEFGDTMATDMDMGTPTSTSTGWSVRTNPIASDESLRTESDDSDHEQGRAVWKNMVLESSPSPTPTAPHTPPAQETENPDINDGFRHRLSHPSTTVTATLMEKDESSQPAFQLNSPEVRSSSTPAGENTLQQKSELCSEEGIVKRTQQGWSFPILPRDGELAMNPVGCAHDDCIDKRSSSETLSPRSEHQSKDGAASDVTAEMDVGNDTATTSAVDDVLLIENESFKKYFRSSLREIFGRGNALFNWQLCVVVVAVPLAIALCKVVFISDPRHAEYLVPT